MAFSWAKVHTRRRAFAREVGETVYGMPRLRPMKDHHRVFYLGEPILDVLHDSKLWELAWNAVALRIDEVCRKAGHYHPIDHAWMIGYDDRQNEPWALVTEPYPGTPEIPELVRQLNEALEDWAIEVRAFPTESSPWNPGGTVPIVASVIEGRGFQTLLPAGAKYMLERVTLGMPSWIAPADPAA
jgi:hypothetical protein